MPHRRVDRRLGVGVGSEQDGAGVTGHRGDPNEELGSLHPRHALVDDEQRNRGPPPNPPDR